jgi:hypothetical protein
LNPIDTEPIRIFEGFLAPSRAKDLHNNWTRFSIAGHDLELRTICTSHVERLNGTQRCFVKRFTRLTYCFSKKLRNLEAAFGMFAPFYNFCWRTRKPGKSGQKSPTVAIMAGLAEHTWTFDELFDAVLAPTQS